MSNKEGIVRRGTGVGGGGESSCGGRCSPLYAVSSMIGQNNEIHYHWQLLNHIEQTKLGSLLSGGCGEKLLGLAVHPVSYQPKLIRKRKIAFNSFLHPADS